MSYEVKYEGPNADKQAIKDTKKYVGQKTWETMLIVVTAQIASGSARQAVHLTCGFAGVQGFPVNAIIRHICTITGMAEPKDNEVNDES